MWKVYLAAPGLTDEWRAGGTIEERREEYGKP
jgi:hypothetical protein